MDMHAFVLSSIDRWDTSSTLRESLLGAGTNQIILKKVSPPSAMLRSDAQRRNAAPFPFWLDFSALGLHIWAYETAAAPEAPLEPFLAAVPYRIQTTTEYAVFSRVNQIFVSRWRWRKKWNVRPVLGPSETDLFLKSWISLGIRPVLDASCAANCWMRNASTRKEKCIVKTTFIGKCSLA